MLPFTKTLFTYYHNFSSLRHYIMRTLIAATTLPASACTDAGYAQLSSLGETAIVDCYSGTRQIYHGRTTGKLHAEEGSDGWFFVEQGTGHLVRVSGACVVRQKTGSSSALPDETTGQLLGVMVDGGAE